MLHLLCPSSVRSSDEEKGSAEQQELQASLGGLGSECLFASCCSGEVSRSECSCDGQGKRGGGGGSLLS